MDDFQTLKTNFINEGFHPKDDWLKQCISFLKSISTTNYLNSRTLFTEAKDQLIHSNFYESHSSTLPKHASNGSMQLDGVYALQINMICYLNKSLYSQYCHFRRICNGEIKDEFNILSDECVGNDDDDVDREEEYIDCKNFDKMKSRPRIPTRLLQLTDGTITINAMELEPIIELNNLGFKVCSKCKIKGPLTIEGGVAYLCKENLEVIGGFLPHVNRSNYYLSMFENLLGLQKQNINIHPENKHFVNNDAENNDFKDKPGERVRIKETTAESAETGESNISALPVVNDESQKISATFNDIDFNLEQNWNLDALASFDDDLNIDDLNFINNDSDDFGFMNETSKKKLVCNRDSRFQSEYSTGVNLSRNHSSKCNIDESHNGNDSFSSNAGVDQIINLQRNNRSEDGDYFVTRDHVDSIVLDIDDSILNTSLNINELDEIICRSYENIEDYIDDDVVTVGKDSDLLFDNLEIPNFDTDSKSCQILNPDNNFKKLKNLTNCAHIEEQPPNTLGYMFFESGVVIDYSKKPFFNYDSQAYFLWKIKTLKNTFVRAFISGYCLQNEPFNFTSQTLLKLHHLDTESQRYMDFIRKYEVVMKKFSSETATFLFKVVFSPEKHPDNYSSNLKENEELMNEITAIKFD